MFNTSYVRLAKGLYTHVCMVFANNKRYNCMGCELLNDCCPDCDVCAPCFSGYQPAPNVTHMTPGAPATYWFTVDATLIMSTDAINSIIQIFILVLLMFCCIYVTSRDGKRLSDHVGKPATGLAKDMEDVSQMTFQDSPKVTSRFYEVC